MSPERMTAEERRDVIVAAASVEFAAAGFAGASTETIARRAGVSQPYVFQLFGTKRDLFLAAIRACFARTRRTFEESGKAARREGLDPVETLIRMGHAYVELLRDRDLLRLQLQSYAACQDPEVRKVVRTEFAALWAAVANVSGASPGDLHAWFAEGMLINVIASIDDARTLDEFDLSMFGGMPGKT